MSTNVADPIHPLLELMRQDQRYHIEAYQFIRESLSYAQDVLQLSGCEESESEIQCEAQSDEEPSDEEHVERHITGQQLCEAIRRYSLDQFGFMAKTVLNSWGVYSTSDFGEIVYNLIRIKHMRKSDSDRREDFNDVYDFATAFDPIFELAKNDESL